MKKLSFVFAVLLMIGSLVACSSGNQTTSGGTETKSNGSNGSSSNNGSGEVITISMGSVASDAKTSSFQQFLWKFQEIVERETDGKVKISIHPNGELGSDREMIESVQLGTLDGVISSSAVLGNFTPLVNTLDFPFLFRDKAHAYQVLDGELGSEIAKEMEPSGLKLLVWAENGYRNMTNSKHPIRNMDDMKGLKIRTQPNEVILDAFNGFGASPTPMEFTELIPALQQGVVHGQENPLVIIHSSKLYEVQKYLTISEHIYQAAPVSINKSKFESLSPEYQEIIQNAAIQARDYQRDFIASMDEEVTADLIANGMEIVTKEEFDSEGFVKAAEAVYKKYEDKYGDFLQRIIDTK